jgi:aspartyl-tRNA synthetase
VLNGWEIGGGSVRIHRPDVQAKVFEALRSAPRTSAASSASCSTRSRTARRRTAASRSGLDRIATLMCGAESIREVIAFPKTQRGQDLLVDTPSTVTEQQLRDLHIKVRPSDAVKTA